VPLAPAVPADELERAERYAALTPRHLRVYKRRPDKTSGCLPVVGLPLRNVAPTDK